MVIFPCRCTTHTKTNTGYLPVQMHNTYNNLHWLSSGTYAQPIQKLTLVIFPYRCTAHAITNNGYLPVEITTHTITINGYLPVQMHSPYNYLHWLSSGTYAQPIQKLTGYLPLQMHNPYNNLLTFVSLRPDTQPIK